MTRRTNILVSLASVALIVSAGFLATSIFRQTQFDASSRDFAVFVTPLILSANPNTPETTEEDGERDTEAPEVVDAGMAWEEHAHSSLLQQQSNEDRSKYLFVVSRNLGALETIQSINGGSETAFPLIGTTPISANYSMVVGFSGGDAEVKLSLIYEDSEWLITNFDVVSNLLAD